MKNIKIMDKKAGTLCMMFGPEAVGATMHIEDETGEKYLTLSWVSEAADVLELNITFEPFYEYLLSEGLSAEEFEIMDNRRSAGESYSISCEDDYVGPYADQLKELTKMIIKKMREENIIDENYYIHYGNTWQWLVDFGKEELSKVDEKYGITGECLPYDEKNKNNILVRKYTRKDCIRFCIAGMSVRDNIYLLVVKHSAGMTTFYVGKNDFLEFANIKTWKGTVSDTNTSFHDVVKVIQPAKRFSSLEECDKTAYKEYFRALHNEIEKMIEKEDFEEDATLDLDSIAYLFEQ